MALPLWLRGCSSFRRRRRQTTPSRWRRGYGRSSATTVNELTGSQQTKTPARCSSSSRRRPRRSAESAADACRGGAAIVPRWEWRTFGDDFGAAERRWPRSSPSACRRATSCTCSRRGATGQGARRAHGRQAARAGDEDGLEQWRPVDEGRVPAGRGGRRAPCSAALDVARRARARRVHARRAARRGRRPSRDLLAVRCTSGARATRSGAAWPS